VPNRPSPARHVRSCERFGVSPAQHHSSVITQADVQWADLIVLMDRANWAALSRIGAPVDKLVWIGALLPGSVEVADPYNLDDVGADRIVDMLYAATESLVVRLKAKA
jgi:protein-tyrosine-phosphatase